MVSMSQNHQNVVERARAWTREWWAGEVEPDVYAGLVLLLDEVRREERERIGREVDEWLGQDSGVKFEDEIAYLRGEGPKPEMTCCKETRERCAAIAEAEGRRRLSHMDSVANVAALIARDIRATPDRGKDSTITNAKQETKT